MSFIWGRSCTDMVFMVRRLAEKTIEQDTVQYFSFVNLCKVCDCLMRSIMDFLAEVEGWWSL